MKPRSLCIISLSHNKRLQEANKLHGAEYILETDSRSFVQNFPYLLWNPKIHYGVQRNPPLKSEPEESSEHSHLHNFFLGSILSILYIVVLYMPKSPKRFRPCTFSEWNSESFTEPEISSYQQWRKVMA